MWLLAMAATKKLRRGVLVDLEQVVDALPEGDTKSLMRDSFARVQAMRALLSDRNEMTENVYMQSLAVSRS